MVSLSSNIGVIVRSDTIDITFPLSFFETSIYCMKPNRLFTDLSYNVAQKKRKNVYSYTG